MSIVLRKRVKAGVLLYALLMLAIFSLILQFYLNRQLATHQLVQRSKEQATAYLMAQMTLDEVKQRDEQLTSKEESKPTSTSREGGKARVPEEEKGSLDPVPEQEEPGPPVTSRQPGAGRLTFQEGEANYQVEKDKLAIQVILVEGKTYHYRLPYRRQLDKEPEKEETRQEPSQSVEQVADRGADRPLE